MDKDAPNVPYIVYESEAARHERTVKRLIVALIVTICLLVASNMAWLYVFNQYDISSESYVVDTNDEGDASFLEAGDNSGVINNGIESGN